MRLSRFVLFTFLFITASRYTVNSVCIFGCSHKLPLPFGFPLFTRFWWEGPNVCNINDTQTTDDSDNFLSHNTTYEQYTQSCRNYTKAYVCTSTVTSNGKTKRTHYGRKCCSGYDRELGGYGCQKETPVTSFLETLKRLNLTVLTSTVEKLNMKDLFSGQRVTFFAPSDAAVSKNSTDNNGISHVVVFEIGNEVQPVRNVLFGATVNGELNTWNLDSMDSLKSMENEGQLIVTHGNTCCNQPFLINCASITESDVEFDNGIIHVVDALIQPVESTILQLLNADSKFSIFLSLMDEETRQKLNDPKSKLTVFAFSNDAFQRLPQEMQQSIKDKSHCFKDLIKYHILNKPMCKKNLHHLAHVESMFGIFDQGCHTACLSTDANGVVKIRTTDKNALMINNSTITSDNRIARNGILFTIDNVIMSDKMRSPLENLANLSPKFQALLKTTDIEKELSTDPYTIFVPPISVINEIEKMNDANDQKKVLRKYVVRGNWKGRDRVVTNMANEELDFKSSQFSWMLDGLSTLGYLSCIKVTWSRTPACGGTLYHLSNSLPYYNKSIMGLLQQRTDLKQFVMLTEAAGFASMLNDTNEALTVMAFTDKEFDNAFDENGKTSLMNDHNALRRFIGKHIVKGSFCCNALINGFISVFFPDNFVTVVGEEQSISGLDESSLRYGNVLLAKCNFGTAKNGVVHLLQRPLTERKVPQFLKPFGFAFDNHPFSNIFDMF